MITDYIFLFFRKIWTSFFFYKLERGSGGGRRVKVEVEECRKEVEVGVGEERK